MPPPCCPTASPVVGPVQLRDRLAARPDQFALTFTEKLMMYGLGREVEPYDMPQVRADRARRGAGRTTGSPTSCRAS